MGQYSQIQYETDGRLAYVTLNRPEKLNALTNTLRSEVMDAMREAETVGFDQLRPSKRVGRSRGERAERRRSGGGRRQW